RLRSRARGHRSPPASSTPYRVFVAGPGAGEGGEHTRRSLDLVDLDPLDGRMRASDVARPEANSGDARLVQQRRVGPGAQSLDARWLADRRQRAAEPPHDGRIDGDVARILRQV